jgi:alpha-D-ribose 1-methylphosphonate 5-triphosphate synthase subunit PhnH
MSGAGIDVALAGFADPVRDAQECFRAILEAMARPGTLMMAGGGLTPPVPLDPATAGVLLTLVDYDTPLWVPPEAAAARDWIAFHCGTGFTGTPERAAFGLALGLPDLRAFSPGTHEQPESAATIIVQVESLRDGVPFLLRGPGLRSFNTVAVRGLPANFVEIWQQNRTSFPLGVDLILCAGNTLTALPRSVTVECG